MSLGGVSAVANGLALPIFTVMFKDLINSGFDMSNAGSSDQVYLMSLRFLYLSFVLFICGTTSSTLLLWTSARQGSAMRKRYLHCILKQDMAWFDSKNSTEISESLERDCSLVQCAIGEKMYSMLFISNFIPPNHPFDSSPQ